MRRAPTAFAVLFYVLRGCRGGRLRRPPWPRCRYFFFPSLRVTDLMSRPPVPGRLVRHALARPAGVALGLAHVPSGQLLRLGAGHTSLSLRGWTGARGPLSDCSGLSLGLPAQRCSDLAPSWDGLLPFGNVEGADGRKEGALRRRVQWPAEVRTGRVGKALSSKLFTTRKPPGIGSAPCESRFRCCSSYWRWPGLASRPGIW